MSIQATIALMGIDRMSNSTIQDMFDDNVARIVRQHAIASTAVSLAAAVPGAGATACVVCQTAVVYSMYVRMNKALGISLSGNVVKSIASAVIANIASNVITFVGSVIASTVLSFIPVLGSAASTIVMGGVGYATVMIAAIAYGKALSAMVSRGKNVETMSESEIKDAVKEELNKRDLNKDMKTFTEEYKRERKSDEFKNADQINLENMEE
ncbi:MAG: hypothetical protein IJC48_04380 [Clostridia bacterium]|nr:hypothetical protein [Clostridia bacterium]